MELLYRINELIQMKNSIWHMVSPKEILVIIVHLLFLKKSLLKDICCHLVNRDTTKIKNSRWEAKYIYIYIHIHINTHTCVFSILYMKTKNKTGKKLGIIFLTQL